MQEKYHVALVGAGVIAQEHLRALRNMKEMKVVAICDTDERKAAQMASEWGIEKHYVDASLMLREETPFIASILTPPQTHAEIAVDALKLGTRVLIEKPMTLTTSDAQLILNTLQQGKGKMTVVYHYLLSRVVQEALMNVKRGELGEILGVTVTLVAGPNEDVMGSNPNHWCHKLTGGRLTEMLPHPVYVLQAFLGDDLLVDSVYATKRGSRAWMPADELRVMLHSSMGTGHVYVSFNAARVAELVDVYCTKKILRIDLTNQTLIAMGRRTPGRVQSATDTLNLAGKLVLADAKNVSRFMLDAYGAYAFRRAYRSLIDGTEEDASARISPNTAYKTVEIVERISKQIQTAIVNG